VRNRESEKVRNNERMEKVNGSLTLSAWLPLIIDNSFRLV